MTLDEFEKWFVEYPKEYQDATFDGSIITLLDWLRSRNYYNSLRSIQHEVKIELEQVEPLEDRNFLILKYSEYLQ